MNLILALLALIAPVAALAQWLGTPPYIEAPQRNEREAPFQARIQHLSDGDSFVVRTEDGRRVTVRLSAIDAPEKAQPFGDVSRRSLLAMVEGKSLTITPIKRDPYGRTVARVLVGEIDIGLAQVRAGMAWHYKRYESEQTPRERREYTSAEQRARDSGLGLWAQPEPVPPWRFREQQRRRQGAALAPAVFAFVNLPAGLSSAPAAA